MGSRKKDFIEKRQLNSLAMGHSILLRVCFLFLFVVFFGCVETFEGLNDKTRLQDFKVTRWLEEGDFIFFDDSNPQIQNSLQVF